MSPALKITSTKWFRSISHVFMPFVTLFGVSCQTLHPEERAAVAPTRLTEREIIYQKGSALFTNAKYVESLVFFLKVAQNSLGPQDEVYNLSLWKLSFVYEKLGEVEKAVLTLLELEKRNSKQIPIFRIQLALAKNYLRLENKDMAFKIEKEIEQSEPIRTYSLNEIYEALEEISNFNYDHLIIEELQFLGEIQKYYIYAMESSKIPINQNATELLIQIYDGFFKILSKDTVDREFKRILCIELLEQLRKFDRYRLNTVNLSPNPISKFSNYSEQKQKFLTDWLHQ